MPYGELPLKSGVANGILLPFVLVFMLILINRRDLMGPMRNRRTGNVIAGSLTVVMIVLTLLLLWQTIVG